jgi:hypothetical protein
MSTIYDERNKYKEAIEILWNDITALEEQTKQIKKEQTELLTSITRLEQNHIKKDQIDDLLMRLKRLEQK